MSEAEIMDGQSSFNQKLDPKNDRLIDEKLAAAMQDAVWTVVSKHPLAGVSVVGERGVADGYRSARLPVEMMRSFP